MSLTFGVTWQGSSGLNSTRVVESPRHLSSNSGLKLRLSRGAFDLINSRSPTVQNGPDPKPSLLAATPAWWIISMVALLIGTPCSTLKLCLDNQGVKVSEMSSVRSLPVSDREALSSVLRSFAS